MQEQTIVIKRLRESITGNINLEERLRHNLVNRELVGAGVWNSIVLSLLEWQKNYPEEANSQVSHLLRFESMNWVIYLTEGFPEIRKEALKARIKYLTPEAIFI